jgi:hypothetical protein
MNLPPATAADKRKDVAKGHASNYVATDPSHGGRQVVGELWCILGASCLVGHWLLVVVIGLEEEEGCYKGHRRTKVHSHRHTEPLQLCLTVVDHRPNRLLAATAARQATGDDDDGFVTKGLLVQAISCRPLAAGDTGKCVCVCVRRVCVICYKGACQSRP